MYYLIIHIIGIYNYIHILKNLYIYTKIYIKNATQFQNTNKK